ncbi:MAG TPA: TonB-dependent receptor plug domain-containing protein, partial [Burkholderiaceae bacterium]|nr:TonB-dependent receptor plug domain-containing protein [Burkholderiaceae bacterium]
MPRKKILGAAIAVLCGAAGAEETTLPDIVVSATLSEHDTRTAPASVTVVTREELEMQNAVDLIDALRDAPGITLTPRSKVGGRKALALRGMDSKHTLTLIDGRRISASDDVVGHANFHYGWLPMVAIERIEIISGPMSTLYGSEALGGVLNLITRQPKERWTGSVAASGRAAASSANDAGGNGGSISVFTGGPVNDSLSLRVSGEHTRSSSVPRKEDPRYSEIEGREATIGSVGATLQLTREQRLEANWIGGSEQRFFDDVKDDDQRRYLNRYDLRRSHASLAWNGEFGSWRGQLRAYRSEIDVSNGPTNGVTPTRPQNMNDQVFDGFATTQVGAHALTAGGELRNESLANSGLKNGNDSARHQALF